MVVVKIMRRGEEVVDYEEQGVKVEDQNVKRMCSRAPCGVCAGMEGLSRMRRGRSL